MKMNKLFLALCSAIAIPVLTWAVPYAPINYEKGELIYSEDFTKDTLKSWTLAHNFEFIPDGAPDGKSGAFKMSGTQERPYAMINKELANPEKYAGKLICFELMVKTDDVNPSLNYYGGAVLNMPNSNDGKKFLWPRAELPVGTRNWTKVSGYAQLFPDLKVLKVNTGIWLTTGSLYVANFRIYEAVRSKDSTPAPVPELAERYSMVKVPSGDNRGAKYRGVQVSCSRSFDFRLVDEMRKWNVNIIRYELGPGKADISSSEKYLAWIDSVSDKLLNDLEALKDTGIKVAIDLHTGPGTAVTEEMSNVLAGTTNIDTLCKAWIIMAKKFKDNPQIYGYDLLNEPRTSDYKVDGKELSWIALAQKMTDAIRSVDEKTPVIVEISGDETVKGENIIYTYHFYSPHEYTHQFVNRSNIGRRIQWAYPGWINGVYYDKEMLRSNLWRVVDFQRKHNVKIFIGEFGCISWAPGAAQYLKDCVELFEEYGWDWIELDFADHNSGFSLTSITSAPEQRRAPKSGEISDRFMVIQDALKKNTPSN